MARAERLLAAAAADLQRTERGAIALAAALAAQHFGAPPDALYRTAEGRVRTVHAEAGRARDLAVWMLVTALGWDYARAGAAFGLRKAGARHAVQRVEDASDRGGTLGAFLTALESLPVRSAA